MFLKCFFLRRGPIWINLNYLAVRALYYYGTQDGPYQQVIKRYHGNSPNDFSPKPGANPTIFEFTATTPAL
jgi:hypothetical protein